MSNSPRLPSERRFGLTFAAVFLAIGVYGYFKGWYSYAIWLLMSALLGAIGAVAPATLGPLNKAWYRLGELLGRIVNPVVLGLIFLSLLTPIAIIARLLGRDELRLRRISASSYWRIRETAIPSPDAFKQQF